jgi:hypothetical protein
MIDWKEQAIRDAETIDSFLKHESVRRVFDDYRNLLWEKWKDAPDPAAREEIHAQARAFDGLAAHLRAAVASGERETFELGQLERANPSMLV